MFARSIHQTAYLTCLAWMNVCEKELRKEWNSRSQISYNDIDLAGNELTMTQVRYITFLGIAKDSVTVSAPKPDDISNIERGFQVAFGLTGSVMALALMLTPWVKSRNRRLYPFTLFICIFFMSKFNDDNFGTFTGATFFSYFYTLFLLYDNKNENDF